MILTYLSPIQLTTNNLRTDFAKISSSKCFLDDFSNNKQIFLPPAPAFRITVPNGLRIIISVLYYQHNAEYCVFILVRLWWRIAEKLVQYEYPHKTAQFCLPYNTLDLLLISFFSLNPHRAFTCMWRRGSRGGDHGISSFFTIFGRKQPMRRELANSILKAKIQIKQIGGFTKSLSEYGRVCSWIAYLLIPNMNLKILISKIFENVIFFP